MQTTPPKPERSEHTFTYVDNTGGATKSFHTALVRAVDDGCLPEALADIFSLKILKGYNADGTDRGIIDWA